MQPSGSPTWTRCGRVLCNRTALARAIFFPIPPVADGRLLARQLWHDCAAQAGPAGPEGHQRLPRASGLLVMRARGLLPTADQKISTGTVPRGPTLPSRYRTATATRALSTTSATGSGTLASFSRSVLGLSSQFAYCWNVWLPPTAAPDPADPSLGPPRTSTRPPTV